MVVTFGVHRAVSENDGRKPLVSRYGNRARKVHLGFQFAVEIDVEEQPFVVGRLAVFEVDLSSNRLVSGGYGRNALRYLNRVEPHAGGVTQSVRRAQSAHYGAVLVENLGVGAGKTEHLYLACARNCVAVTDGYRRRVLETLGEVAACHFAQSGERNRFAFQYSVVADVVAAEITLDDDGFEFDALTQFELNLRHGVVHAQCVVLVAEERSDERVVALDAVKTELAVDGSRRTDVGVGPVDGGSGHRVVFGIGYRTRDVLCVCRCGDTHE